MRKSTHYELGMTVLFIELPYRTTIMDSGSYIIWYIFIIHQGGPVNEGSDVAFEVRNEFQGNFHRALKWIETDACMERLKINLKTNGMMHKMGAIISTQFVVNRSKRAEKLSAKVIFMLHNNWNEKHAIIFMQGHSAAIITWQGVTICVCDSAGTLMPSLQYLWCNWFI